MRALRFQTCRLLEGNVWKRELTIIQRRILKRLRKKKRSIKRRIHSRKNLNSYIQLQTTRKLALFYGDLPITEMHRRRKGTSYIPFLLNLETRLDVILVRIHFCESLPQARLLISHRKVCVNQVIVCISHFKVSYGDIISFQENEARTRGEEIKRSFYIEILVEKRIGKFLNSPVRMWRRSKTEWFRLLKTKRGWRQLLKSDFLQELRSSMQKEDLEKMKKLLGSKKVCLGSYLAEHKRMKRNFYDFKFLSRRRKEKKRDLPPLTRSTKVYKSSLLGRNSTYCSAPSHLFTRRSHPFTRKRKIKRKRIELPTHYLEVNYRTPKAVVSYGPNIRHIPHDIKWKDLNLLLRSGKGRGQNI